MGFLLACLSVVLFADGCHHDSSQKPVRLSQRGYLWQRDWTPAVADAMREAGKHLDGVVVLGAEVLWNGKTPQAIKATISWPELKASPEPCALALRIAPYPGPFSEDDEQVRAIAGVAKSLLDEARNNGVTLSEFQIDFDCAQDKLDGYRAWLRTLAKVAHPTRLVITTLPAWLDEPGFPALVKETDGYILQVHSVPTRAESGRTALCDPILARKWVTKASDLGMPFSVALPTYWCLAGYDPGGKLFGVAMDSVQPSWPPGTRTLEFGTNADELAALVREWDISRPPGMQGLLWYRLPVVTDLRNWRWPTLLAVMAGRGPSHRMKVIREGDAPVDFTLVNSGEADEPLNCDMVVRWSDSKLLTLDALPGWTVSPDEGKAVFTTNPDYRLRLLPGEKVGIGWIRFEKEPVLQTEIVPHHENSP